MIPDAPVNPVDGRIYVSGGETSGETTWGKYSEEYSNVPTVEVYDPVTDTWTQASDMPWPRMGHSTNVVDGKMYFIGGYDPEVVRLFEAVR